MSSNDFYNEYYGSLIGATILDFKMVQDEDDSYIQWPTFTVKLADNTVIDIEVSQDTEGNGSGFLFGLPMPVSA